jgi:hypothetical protein
VLSRDSLVGELDGALRAAANDELVTIDGVRRARLARRVDLQGPAHGAPQAITAACGARPPGAGAPALDQRVSGGLQPTTTWMPGSLSAPTKALTRNRLPSAEAA